VRAFPTGATPLDFAYGVHTQVGHTCVGARISGKMVPLRTELKNGDIVEILTRPDAHPSRDWLRLVKTSRAKAKIRQWLNVHARKQATEVGRAQLDKELRRHKLSLRRFERQGQLESALKELNYRSLEEFLAGVGYGKTTPQSLLRTLIPELGREPEEAAKPPRQLRKPPKQIQVRGADDILTTLAKCCNPIRGEPILGYITRGRGVSVHRADCPNVENLLYDPDRRIEVSWAQDAGGTYEVPLELTTEDRPGILAAISSSIAETGTNIKTGHAESFEDGKAQIDIILEVRDILHLQKLMDHLKRIPGIILVEKKT
jgi:GTP pyrophosphokinase